jgi:YfiH family protein
VLVKRDIAGVVVYQSPLLLDIALSHAFTTRLGGISPDPFDSLNLGNPNGCPIQDTPERIAENYRRLCAAIGDPNRELTRVHQVHGSAVARAVAGRPFDVHQCADAIVSDDPRRWVSVRVADCTPVLLSADDGSIVAVIHAGWRGVIAGVVSFALAEMNHPPNRLLAAIGPCIGMEAFEVGSEVLAAFSESFGPSAPIRHRPDGKGHVDLRAAIRLQLLSAGVDAARIDMTDRCTFCDRDEFFSHRRDSGITGRMAALISPKP